MALLHLRTRATGPYLQENLNAYKILDQAGQEVLTVVMAIGGQTKRQFLAVNSADYVMEDYSLSLSQWPSWNNLFLLDCELHLQQSQEAPRTEEPQFRHCVNHPLKNYISQVESIIGSLYGDIALSFCDLTLIFISDIGGFINAIDVLCRWMYRALNAAYLTQANVFLVIDESSIKENNLWLNLATTMLSTLRKSQPHATYTLTEVMHFSRQCFDIKIKGREEVYTYLCSNMRAKLRHRRSMGLEFSAAQWKYLFRSAIVRHAMKPSLPFDLITATRISYPLPGKAGENISDFLRACGRQDVDHPQVIASALVMNAFPQDMPGK